MVIRGNIRGNGQQLAHYLTSKQGNERVQILDVAGRQNANETYLHQTLLGMSLLSELTRSTKGLYHAQINPAYQEDKRMTPETWRRATDILARHLGLENQRRIIVLHTKKDRTHAHVVFERYDHQTGKIIPHRFSRLAQDRARKEMEQVFDQKPTPHRNPHRPELREALTLLWQQSETGADFIKAVHEKGYLIAEGVPRHPFMVVDEQGRSFDLVRQLKGVRIKEVRQQLRHAKLISEKDAIEHMRQKAESGSKASPMDYQQTDGASLSAAEKKQRQVKTATAFMEASQDIFDKADEKTKGIINENTQTTFETFEQTKNEMTATKNAEHSTERQRMLALQFFENDITANSNAEDELKKLIQEQKDIRQKSLQKKRRRSR
ncbi:relaxase/mobilization nuclease domain-containing protein [Siphonobacter sp. SORGH_AS_1065]|uniref:relaxase/mobilization nuclease domain-containing protein n=1 Tax=Siphonobacter sp. SORGH_AS_1065 TaxID=3041795 RepID=UPI0027844BE9|nr:relaxase/mobilization nuclease domain-containing protein [Siphonobacter sp. SORGH_AS_1065]MDQ1086184.1 hypothetical protein [Siphonobacter sp. SORGH_AS_1065]